MQWKATRVQAVCCSPCSLEDVMTRHYVSAKHLVPDPSPKLPLLLASYCDLIDVTIRTGRQASRNP